MELDNSYNSAGSEGCFPTETYGMVFRDHPCGMILFEFLNPQGENIRVRDVNNSLIKASGLKFVDAVFEPFNSQHSLYSWIDIGMLRQVFASGLAKDYKHYIPQKSICYNVHISKVSNILSAVYMPVVEPAGCVNEASVIEKGINFERLFKEHSAAQLLIDAQTGNLIDVNDAAVDYYGWTKQELRLMHISEINVLSVAELKSRLSLINNTSRQCFDFQHRHKDGSVTDVTVYVHKIELSGKEYLHSIVHDVTARKKAEYELKSHLTLLEIAGRTARFGGWSIVVDTNECYWSDVVAEIHELPTDLVPNAELGISFYAPEYRDMITKAFQECINEGISYDVELQIITAKGRRVWVRTTGEALRDEEGKIYKVHGSFQDIDDRKKAEIAFSESQKLYHSFVEHIPGAVFRKDLEGRYIFVNSVFCKMKSMSSDEILGKLPKELYDYEEKNVVPKIAPGDFAQRTLVEGADHHSEIVSTGKTIHTEEIYQFRDGKRFYYEVIKSPVYNIHGEIIGSQGIQFDITERKRIELVLKEKERELATIISNLPGFVYKCAYDADWTIWYISEGCKQITGYAPDDLIQSKTIAFNDMIDPAHHQRIYDKWKRILAMHEVFTEEYPIIHANGETRWVWEQGRGVYDENGVLLHLEGFITDVSDRKKAEKALFESEQKLRKMFRQMTELVVLCNALRDEAGNITDYNILDCNDSFVNVYGVTYEDCLNQNFSKAFSKYPLMYVDEIEQVLATGKTCELELYSDDTNRYFHVSLVHLYDDVFAVIANDVTESKIYSQKLLEKNKELEGYVYITSHDLRSPLVNIQGFSARLNKQTEQLADLLRAVRAEDELRTQIDSIIKTKIPDTLDYIFNNVSKMDKMLNGLLQISRTGRLPMNIQRVDMNGLINKVIRYFEFQITEIEASVTVDHLPECYGDENLLNQLFANLIGNSIKYKHPERKLNIHISGQKNHDKVTYCVADNGIGIARNYHQKIWNVFFRVDVRSIPGDGIGLNLARQIVEKHKGKITLNSTEGKGCTFCVELLASEFSE